MEYSVTTPTDLMILLRDYQALTIFQICKLLNKVKTRTNILEKLQKLEKNGLVASQRLPRLEPVGSSPFCYSLTREGHRALANTTDLPISAKLSGVALEHTISIADVAVLAHLLTRQETRITLSEIRTEALMKKNPIMLKNNGGSLVPDLFIRLTINPPFGKQNEQIGLIFEIDHKGTEWADIIKDKAKKYVDISYGIYQDYFGLESLTVIFLVTGNGKFRVKNILSWIQEALYANREDADIFLCAAVDPVKTPPLQFFCDPLYQQPFATSLHPIIEKP